MIDDVTAAVARAAAEELVPQYGSRLAVDVENAISMGDGRRPGEQYFDPVALGALIVAIAQFGYQVYSDQRKKGQRPTREAITESVRIEHHRGGDLTAEETAVIEIVVTKMIEYAEGEPPEQG